MTGASRCSTLRARSDALGLTHKSQEEAKGIPIGCKSPGAGMLLVEQILDEKGLHQARRGYRGRGHSSTCRPANDSKRLPALRRSSGVAVRYQ